MMNKYIANILKAYYGEGKVKKLFTCFVNTEKTACCHDVSQIGLCMRTVSCCVMIIITSMFVRFCLITDLRILQKEYLQNISE